jgi:hypothetical protein
MSVQGFKQWGALLVCVALVFAIGVLPSSAQERMKIAGKMTLNQPTRQAMEIGDTPGHEIALGQAQGINISTGEHKFMDSAQVVNMAFDDLTQGNGPEQGYVRLAQKADTVIIKWQGQIGTTLAADKTQKTTFQGAWYTTKGTGQFQNIQAKGSYKGEFVSKTEYTVDWEGEYLLLKK